MNPQTDIERSAQTEGLIFDVPGGRLRFGPGDLDVWAEHLVWCYRLMGVGDGATIAVQDFGTSPLAFLGSSLLMPGLAQGVAERLGGKFIGLDASTERVTLTPAVLAQLAVDVLVVRAEVADLLHEVMQRAGTRFQSPTDRIVVALPDDDAVPARTVPWRYLICDESAMLLAPECPHCGHFHLRGGFYQVEGDVVRNLRLGSARPHQLASAELLRPGNCPSHPEDFRIRYVVRDARAGA
jgi:hypothetical protein